jgi:hypothetical protein
MQNTQSSPSLVYFLSFQVNENRLPFIATSRDRTGCIRKRGTKYFSRYIHLYIYVYLLIKRKSQINLTKITDPVILRNGMEKRLTPIATRKIALKSSAGMKNRLTPIDIIFPP